MAYKINHIEDLALNGVSPHFVHRIVENALSKEDQDWFSDICSELDTIEPTSKYYIEDFHKPLIEQGIKSKDVNPNILLY